MFKHSVKAGILILALLTQNAWADFATCGKSSDELNQFRSGKNYTQLAAAYIENCAAHSQLLSEVQVFLARVRSAEENAARANAVRQTVLLLSTRFNEQFSGPGAGNPDAVKVMRKELECEQLALTSKEALEESDCENNLFDEDFTLPLLKWWPNADGPIFDEAFATPFAAVDGSCPQEKPGKNTKCDTAFTNDFLPVLEYQSVMHAQVRPAANQKPAEQITAYYSSSHEKWKSYLSDTGFQYPWELTFNRWKRGGFEEIARREEAPTSRFILLHPTVAIAHSEESPDGDQVRMMGVLKVFGYKWWGFNNNRANNVWGISGTVTVADVPDVDDAGYGVMVEYNQFALGWSNHGDDHIVSVSIDLGALLSDRPDTLQGWLDRLE